MGVRILAMTKERTKRIQNTLIVTKFGIHRVHSCMKKTIDMMAQPIEKNNIPLPEGARNKEGGLNYENKDRFHALVFGSSRSSYFIIDSCSLRNMDSVQ